MAAGDDEELRSSQRATSTGSVMRDCRYRATQSAAILVCYERTRRCIFSIDQVLTTSAVVTISAVRKLCHAADGGYGIHGKLHLRYETASLPAGTLAAARALETALAPGPIITRSTC